MVVPEVVLLILLIEVYVRVLLSPSVGTDGQFLDRHRPTSADRAALIAKYKGHAIVTFTGKAYDQTYITEIHTRNGKVTYYAEYFDTAVLNAAFTP